MTEKQEDLGALSGSSPSGQARSGLVASRVDPERGDSATEPFIVRVARLAHARADKEMMSDLADEMAEHADRDLSFFSLLAFSLESSGLVLRRAAGAADNDDALDADAIAMETRRAET